MNHRKPKLLNKSHPYLSVKAKTAAPRTADEYYSKSPEFRDRWNRITHVVSRMRVDSVSLRKASREFGLSPQTVIRLGGTALRKRANGQYAPRASDHLLRVLVIPTAKGLQEVAVRDSRHASDLGKYWDAVQGYLETGDSSVLRLRPADSRTVRRDALCRNVSSPEALLADATRVPKEVLSRGL
jgi:hypothetical protein